MPNRERITCRIAVQICIGRFPDGRERHRTFSIKDIRPDVSWEAVAKIIRALAPVLKFPITKVTKVTQRVLFWEDDDNIAAREPQVEAVPVNAVPVPEAARIIPFPFSFSPVAKRPDATRRGAIFCRAKTSVRGTSESRRLLCRGKKMSRIRWKTKARVI